MKLMIWSMQKIIVLGSVLGLLVIFGGGTPLLAQEGIKTRNWELILGAGGIAKPEYNGAENVSAQFFPFIRAQYKTRYIEGFLGIEGVGVTIKPTGQDTVKLSTGIGLSQGRNSDGDVKDLEGTAKLDSNYQVFGLLEIPVLRFGTLSSRISFLPIEASYDEEERPNTDYDGLLIEATWGNGWSLRPNIFLNTQIGMSWMNAEYAEAFYSVEYPTERFQVFEAGSGIENVHSFVRLTYMFTQHIGTSVFTEGRYLLGDAGDSPLTQKQFQPSGGMVLFYNF